MYSIPPCWDRAKHSVGKHGFTAYYTLAHKKKLDRGVVGPLLPHIIAHCCGKGGTIVSTGVCWDSDGAAGVEGGWG